ncbi:Inner membrane protein YedI [Rhabdaerophilaceae bacterium]
MSVGLIALLDDVVALAKVAAASLDDVASQAAQAGGKAAGVVIDDAAVTPRYVTGFSPARELPIIGKIAVGSLKNKLIILLPMALLLSYFAPWAITPLLMIGGVYLCFEGAEKVYGLIVPHASHEHAGSHNETPVDAKTFEDEKVAGAIKTDFILSAEIMAIALGSIPSRDIWVQSTILAVVAVGITVAVYGAVALIVKADDFGLFLARSESRSALGATRRVIGRALVKGMPYFLKVLGLIGTAAMIWVGGGIILHGFETYGLGGAAHFIHDAGSVVKKAVPSIGGFLGWLVEAGLSGIVGLVIGGLAIPLTNSLAVPAWNRIRTVLSPR